MIFNDETETINNGGNAWMFRQLPVRCLPSFISAFRKQLILTIWQRLRPLLLAFTSSPLTAFRFPHEGLSEDSHSNALGTSPANHSPIISQTHFILIFYGWLPINLRACQGPPACSLDPITQCISTAPTVVTSHIVSAIMVFYCYFNLPRAAMQVRGPEQTARGTVGLGLCLRDGK